LSIFPLLLLLIDLLGLLFQSGPGFQQAVYKYFARVAPSSASSLIDRTLAEAAQNSGPIKLSLQLLFTWLPRPGAGHHNSEYRLWSFRTT
jgi:uncharacterized BrkB/YihY/UPF0761 family membrane protein